MSMIFKGFLFKFLCCVFAKLQAHSTEMEKVSSHQILVVPDEHYKERKSRMSEDLWGVTQVPLDWP